MLDALFSGIFDTALTTTITPGAFVLCVGVSLLIGLMLCTMTLWRSNCTRSFAVTLAILPAVVCVVILMVNGNVGTGVAVAGAFNLVRFRSAPGSAREIGAIFVAMGTGLMAGMGYLAYALLFALILGGVMMLYAADTDKVQLVLDGVTIHSATSAAIYALEADKVFVTLADGSENTLSNGGSYVAIDDNNIDAVIFSKTDLTLNGSGSLTIQAQAGHGVVSKDELVVTGGSYTVTSASHGMTGKDSVAIAGGVFTITSGKDGIHAENTEDTTLGALYIAGGSYTIHAQGDAISASGTPQIDGGAFELTTGEGSASVEMSTDESFAPGRPGTAVPQETSSTEEDTVSQKGIKGESTYTINGGTFTIDSADDCLHAGGAMVIAAGEFNLSSGDDAVHCDDALTIQSGTFTIPYCYEGIEGLTITVEGGTFDITSHDDGLNAAGGADSSGFGGFGGRPQDTFASSSDSFITINGGTFTIVSSGDCIDSNGDLTINGGTLDLTCNGSGNTTLDCDGTYTNNGGDVTTNDGSESNPGGMTGGGGMGGQRPDRGGGQPPSMPEETAPTA